MMGEISGQVMVVKFVSPPLQAVISGLHVMLPLLVYGLGDEQSEENRQM